MIVTCYATTPSGDVRRGQGRVREFSLALRGRDSFVLLCSYCTRVHMELRRDRKRTLKVREMVEAEEYLACEYLVSQEADGSKGADVESPKRYVKCEQREWDCLVIGVDKE